MSKSPVYRSIHIDLVAGGEQTVNASGEIVTVKSADGSFDMSFEDNSFFEAEAGLGFEPFDPSVGGVQTFRSLRFRDTSGAANKIVVQIGTGRINDNRSVFGSSELPVKTNPATELNVVTLPGSALNVQAAGGGALPVDNTALTALYGRELATEGGSTKKLGASNFNGAAAAAAGVTLVSAAANVNGVRVTNLTGVNCNGNAVMLKAGGVAFCNVTAYGGANSNPSYDGPDIIVPAGLALTIHHTASLGASCFYDIL